jgi:RNA-binding protein YhbY
MQQLLGHGPATRHGSLPGGEVGKQLFVSRPTYLSSSPVRHPVLSIAGIRFKGTKTRKKGPKKKKAKEVRMKLKRIRMERKARKAAMSPEETLEYRIAKQKKKVMLHEEQLKKKYQLPEFPEHDPDPESLTPEQLYTLKKLGYKNKNYVPVGRRGIYGGTIQNMHMHWKKHETVRLCCDNFPKEKIKAMGEQLERLSGGIVIDIHQAKTIIMWRGRNYKRPKNDIPEVFKNFNKRKVGGIFILICLLNLWVSHKRGSGNYSFLVEPCDPEFEF